MNSIFKIMLLSVSFLLMATGIRAAVPPEYNLLPVNGNGAIKVKLKGENGYSLKNSGGIIKLIPGPKIEKGKPTRFKVEFSPLNIPAKSGEALVIVLRLPAGSSTRNGRLEVIWQQKEGKKKEKDRVFFRAGRDWQEVVVPLPGDITKPDSVTLIFNSFAGYEIKQLKICKPRWIDLSLSSDPELAGSKFTVQGECDVEAAKILLNLKDPGEKTYTKTVKPVNGIFRYTWNNPPVKAQKAFYLSAKIVGKDSPMATSLPLKLFAYRDNYDFAWLKVDGSRLVTARDGKEFIPVGVGYCRDVIIAAQDDEVAEFCKSHHLNTIRLAFYNVRFNSKMNRPIDIEEHIRQHIEPVIDAARRNDLYVILDDHEYFHEKIDEKNARGRQKSRIWSKETLDKWVNNWTKVADRYKDNPTVLGYELLNEPFEIPPEQVREFYQRCIKAIRKVDKKHIIIVGGCDWSHARSMEKTWGPVAGKIDEPYNNVVFAFHDYPKDNRPPVVQKHITRFRNKYNVPVLCTEFGATHWMYDETDCRKFISGMLAMCAKEDVGWMIWALKTLEDQPVDSYHSVDGKGKRTIPVRRDSCKYSDMWPQAAEIMASPFPVP